MYWSLERRCVQQLNERNLVLINSMHTMYKMLMHTMYKMLMHTMGTHQWEGAGLISGRELGLHITADKTLN